MLKSVIIVAINLIIILLATIFIPNINYSRVWIFCGLILLIPLSFGFILYKAKKEYYHKAIFIGNIILALFFSYMLVTIYQSHHRDMQLNFDKRNIHHLQTDVEEHIKKFIRINAKHPESYEPVGFTNLDSMKVYEGAWVMDNKELMQKIEDGNMGVLDTIGNKREFKNFRNYFIQHSYYLKNRSGRRLGRVLFIEINKEFEIIEFYNREDFPKISWYKLFGKNEIEE